MAAKQASASHRSGRPSSGCGAAKKPCPRETSAFIPSMRTRIATCAGRSTGYGTRPEYQASVGGSNVTPANATSAWPSVRAHAAPLRSTRCPDRLGCGSAGRRGAEGRQHAALRGFQVHEHGSRSKPLRGRRAQVSRGPAGARAGDRLPDRRGRPSSASLGSPSPPHVSYQEHIPHRTGSRIVYQRAIGRRAACALRRARHRAPVAETREAVPAVGRIESACACSPARSGHASGPSGARGWKPRASSRRPASGRRGRKRAAFLRGPGPEPGRRGCGARGRAR